MTFNLQVAGDSIVFQGQPRVSFEYHGVERVVEPRSVRAVDNGADHILCGLEVRRNGKPSWAVKSFRISKMGAAI
jgi:hypothetical protein